MAVAQPWKKPELTDQPELKRLNDALHDLRLDAGLPSARTIRDRVGQDAQGFWIVNHQAALDVFQKPDLPSWGRVELIVVALAEDARRNDVDAEVNRFKDLWKDVVKETVAQASLRPPPDATPATDVDGLAGLAEGFANLFKTGAKDTNGQAGDAPPSAAETPEGPKQAASQFDYAEESLKGLIINAAQALWHDKDALRIFLGVVRRSAGFTRMADAVEQNRPANATFYGVHSREFEVEYSPGRSELVALHRVLDEQRRKHGWSFTEMERQTGVSAAAWIRWYTHDELPEREALVAFSHMAHLMLEDDVLLLGLWEAARDALDVQRRLDALPSGISFDEAWAMRDPAAPRLWVLAGVGGDDLKATGPDLGSGTASAFVVAGPAKSGRSTVMVNIARSLLANGIRLVLAAPRPSPLRDLADRDGVVACFDQGDIQQDELEAVLSEASSEEPVVVMDDAEALRTCGAGRLLDNLLQHGFDTGTALVLGGDEVELGSGLDWSREMKKAHRGLLLSPQTRRAGDLIGIRIGDAVVGRVVTPGRGWLHLGDGRLLAVSVPR